MIAIAQSELGRALFEESGDALLLLDPETDRLIEVNPVALRLTGYARDEILPLPASYLFRFEAAGGSQRLRAALQKTMVFHSQDGFLLRGKADGAWVPVNLTVSRLHGFPSPLALIIARDDRDRRAAFTQVQRVEAELRTVLASSPAALWSAERPTGPDVTAGWQFRYVSPLMARIAGRPAEFFDHPFRWAEVVHPQDRERYRTDLRDLLCGRDAETEWAYRVQAVGGAVRWVREKLRVVRDSSARPTRLDGCLEDLTEELQAEEALLQNERRFRALVEKSRDGIFLLDAEGVVRYASPTVTAIFGHDPVAVTGKDCLALVHADDRAAFQKQFTMTLHRPGEDLAWQFRGLTAAGGVRVLETNGCNRLADPSVRAVVLNYRDVTDQTRLEDGLRQATKMEAVGRLAGGIAHDFNNILTVILGNLELLGIGVTPDDARELIAATETAARHAADLTKQMLGFARRQPVCATAVDLNQLVHESVGLLRRTTDPRVAFALNLAELRPVAADAGQLRQVIVNLCLNARDAMPDGGTLTLETADTGDAASAFVRLSVSDTGCGMSDEVRAKIFDPFFTTKGVGQGTGLGLAVVYGAARAHGGRVECSSAPGRGSRFDVYLSRGVRVSVG